MKKITIKQVFIGLSLSLVVWATSSQADDCNMPTAPNIPDGTSSTYDEMIATQKAIKSFQSDAEVFRKCLDELMSTLREASTDGDAGAIKEFNVANDRYNQSVSVEESLATEFNAAIKAYKAANPSQ